MAQLTQAHLYIVSSMDPWMSKVGLVCEYVICIHECSIDEWMMTKCYLTKHEVSIGYNIIVPCHGHKGIFARGRVTISDVD